MSNISIYRKSWIDIVFEGRNQQYGAYILRRENGRTTLLAFLSGLSVICIFALIPMLSTLISEKPNAIATPEIYTLPDIHLTNVNFSQPKPKIQAQATATATDTPKQQFKNPVVVHPDESQDFTTAPSQPTPIANTPSGTATATDPTTNAPPVIAASPPGNNPETTATVDKLPEFPGGLAKFYDFVAKNFEKPEIDVTVTILLSFVVEKDGSITDVKVLRNPGYGLDKEAIRVLKSLRLKWQPGIKDGKPVRTLYNFPIKVKANE